MKKTSRIIKPIMAVCIAVLCLLSVDLVRVNLRQKPICSLPIKTADDGGSGKYLGLGYMFDIRGNFILDDANYGVTHYRMYLLGIPLLDITL